MINIIEVHISNVTKRISTPASPLSHPGIAGEFRDGDHLDSVSAKTRSCRNCIAFPGVRADCDFRGARGSDMTCSMGWAQSSRPPSSRRTDARTDSRWLPRTGPALPRAGMNSAGRTFGRPASEIERAAREGATVRWTAGIRRGGHEMSGVLVRPDQN